MQSSWIFKPRFELAVVEKVLKRICNDYLNWWDHGYEWTLTSCAASGHPDWLKLEVYPDGNEHNQYYTETIYNPEPLEAHELVDDMLILLTSGQQACAYENETGDGDWRLEDVELSSVLCSLYVLGSTVYSP